MPHETFRGPDVPGLLARAQAVLGHDAALLSVRRVAGEQGPLFEVVAADALTARALGAGTPRAFGSEPLRRADTTAARAAAPREKTFASALRRTTESAPLRIAVVGPTGAGKTTTLAKLASHPRVFGARKPGLLCLDTYRIGAIEQSKIFADLARIPHEVAWSLDDLDPALRRLKACDVLLIDTAGRGPRQRADLESTFDQLRRLSPDEIHLVLPAGLAAPLARRIVTTYRALGITHLLATKCDECPEDRTVFDLAVECGVPMRWYANGQEVPADLHAVMTADLLARGARVAAEVA